MVTSLAVQHIIIITGTTSDGMHRGGACLADAGSQPRGCGKTQLLRSSKDKPELAVIVYQSRGPACPGVKLSCSRQRQIGVDGCRLQFWTVIAAIW